MRRFFLDNLQLKIAAILLAVVLWLIVTSRGQTEIALNVPIEYINIPSGIEITKHMANSANVVIKGHESILKNIRRGDVRVAMDVSSAKKGENTFHIRKDDIRLPYTVSVTKIEPSSVKLVFEETVSKKVIIKPIIVGTPDTGYYVKQFELEPKDVVVEGANSEVRKIGYIKTESIDISGLTENSKLEVALDISGKNIRTNVDRVDVHIKIGKRGR